MLDDVNILLVGISHTDLTLVKECEPHPKHPAQSGAYYDKQQDSSNTRTADHMHESSTKSLAKLQRRNQCWQASLPFEYGVGRQSGHSVLCQIGSPNLVVKVLRPCEHVM